MMLVGEERARDVNLGSLFGQSSPPLVGLDISTSGVRLVELADAGKGELRLERYASEPLPRGAVVDGNIENIDQVSEAVRRVWKKSGTRVKLVALGMPPASVITKKIILPAGLSEDQLEVQVESEASQYIPFALDEVSLDFDVLGMAANSPDDMDVMLAAARKEKVEDRVAIAEAAGLTAVVMDIESYAARAALERVTEPAAGRAGPDHRAVPDRRPGHPHFGDGRRRHDLRARAAVRRQPADPGHRARLRPVVRGGRRHARRPATCRKTTRPNCSARSSRTPRWK